MKNEEVKQNKNTNQETLFEGFSEVQDQVEQINTNKSKKNEKKTSCNLFTFNIPQQRLSRSKDPEKNLEYFRTQRSRNLASAPRDLGFNEK